MAGRRVRLIAHVRRFYCDTVLCGRRIFVERFDSDVLEPARAARHALSTSCIIWRLLLAGARRRILVIGAGYSAANVLIDLARLAEDARGTSAMWVVRAWRDVAGPPQWARFVSDGAGRRV